MNMTTVSIGISAYNEESNIISLLNQLLNQVEENFALEELILISDGSTDETYNTAVTISHPKLLIVNHDKREGLVVRENEILGKFKGEILVLINADTHVEDKMFISNLIQPLLLNKNAGIVGAKVSPLPPRNFFGQVINNSAILKQKIYEQINHGENLYLCHGRARAFSRKFADNIRFPLAPGEDAFSYIKCKQIGMDFIYQPKAVVFYRSPETVEDHLRQSVRFFNSKSRWKNEYGNKNYYHIPKSILVRETTKNYLQHPVLLTFYLCVYIYARIKSIWHATSIIWETSASSKNIN